MTPDDFSALRRVLARDRFAMSSGIELLEVEAGYARAQLAVEDRHRNGFGTVQGGAIFTLADLAFAAACNSRGVLAVGATVSISYVKAATGGTLHAEAREFARTRRLSHCTVRVTDDQQELVAVFHGMAYCKHEQIVDVESTGRPVT
jgi:acyl-CoA thioesterase